MRFDLIYSDPPWSYNARITRGDGNRSKFGNGAPYPLMSDRALLDLAPLVKAVTAPRAMMFMWATKPRLDFAIELLRAWGFQYATAPFVWVKTTNKARRMWRSPKLEGISGDDLEGFLDELAFKGPGSYTNDATEIVIAGRRGPMLPKRYHLPDGTIFAPRREHSRKPERIREILEDWIVAENRLEMFCRYPAPGWTVTGNGVVDEDISESLRRLHAIE